MMPILLLDPVLLLPPPTLAQAAKATLCRSTPGNAASSRKLSGNSRRRSQEIVFTAFLSRSTTLLRFVCTKLSTNTFNSQPAGISDFAFGTLVT